MNQIPEIAKSLNSDLNLACLPKLLSVTRYHGQLALWQNLDKFSEGSIDGQTDRQTRVIS